jgi:hypothetical protein
VDLFILRPTPSVRPIKGSLHETNEPLEPKSEKTEMRAERLRKKHLSNVKSKLIIRELPGDGTGQSTEEKDVCRRRERCKPRKLEFGKRNLFLEVLGECTPTLPELKCPTESTVDLRDSEDSFRGKGELRGSISSTRDDNSVTTLQSQTPSTSAKCFGEEA